MSKKMILLFSHKLTSSQIQDAVINFKISTFVSLPEELQQIWSNVPEDTEIPENHLEQIRTWILSQTKVGDFILIHGAFGMAYRLVNWSFQNKLIPVYATTKRIHTEKHLENGKVEIKKIFHHIKFRRYHKGK